jgi:hypothetical protein
MPRKDGTVEMAKFLRRSLTKDVLMALDGHRYVGRIERVVEQEVFNRFKFTKEERVPVIEFNDEYGTTWIPNRRSIRDLMAALGSNSDSWVGRRIAVYLKAVARTQAGSGRSVERLEKFVEVFDDQEAAP